MYMGKKFNSMKENADGEKFKGIQIIRFYIKCGTCSNQMSFKTDPENDDYVMESGGTRTFEMWQETNAVAASNLEERIDEDKDDAMTALENRTKDTQKMVDMLDALDELKAVSQRNERMDASALLTSVDGRRKNPDDLDADDEALVKSISFGKKGGGDKLPGGAKERDVAESDDTFVLEELEQRSLDATRKKSSGKRGKKPVEQSLLAKDDLSREAGPSDDFNFSGLEDSKQVNPADALQQEKTSETEVAGSLLEQVQKRASEERGKDTTVLPVLKKRKKKAEAKAEAPAQAVDQTSHRDVAETGGLLGLGSYGSESE